MCVCVFVLCDCAVITGRVAKGGGGGHLRLGRLSNLYLNPGFRDRNVGFLWICNPLSLSLAQSNPMVLKCLILVLCLSLCVAEQADEVKAKLKPCDVFALNGFDNNEWMNCWVTFWKHNTTCSTKGRRCYTKKLDSLIWITNLHRKFHNFVESHISETAAGYVGSPAGEELTESNLAYLKWWDGSWYVSSSAESPEEVYAQLKSKKKRPPSSDKWEAYNGTAMVRSNVTARCVDDTHWLETADILMLSYPYMLGMLGVLYLFFLCYPLGEGGAKPDEEPKKKEEQEKEKKDQ